MSNFDWYWSMCDSNYKVEKIRAENAKNSFLQVLRKIDDKKIVNALRDVWTAHYKLALPYMKSDYYEEKKQALRDAEDKLQELTQVTITI